MLDFCGTHNITADVEVIPIQKVDEAYEQAAQVGREVPLLHRHGLAEVGMTLTAVSCTRHAGLRRCVVHSPLVGLEDGFAQEKLAEEK